MSAWRILVKNLYNAGKASPLRDIDDWSMSHTAIAGGIEDAKRLGLMRSLGMFGRHAVYELTQVGVDFAEGRIIVICGRHPIDAAALRNTNGAYRHRVHRPKAPRSMRLCATWLASLPRAQELRT